MDTKSKQTPTNKWRHGTTFCHLSEVIVQTTRSKQPSKVAITIAYEVLEHDGHSVVRYGLACCAPVDMTPHVEVKNDKPVLHSGYSKATGRELAYQRLTTPDYAVEFAIPEGVNPVDEIVNQIRLSLYAKKRPAGIPNTWTNELYVPKH